MECVFHQDPTLSEEIRLSIKNVLNYVTLKPHVDSHNKQILWPTSDNPIIEDAYINLIPLYPISLTYDIYTKIQEIKFGEDVKSARDKRSKGRPPYLPYPVIKDLAVTSIGGANAQNVSRLNAKQGGKHYLLPSYPPIFRSTNNLPLKRSDDSLFNQALKYRCRSSFEVLKNTLAENKNNLRIRQSRQHAVDEIIATILFIADDINEHWAPGWSQEFSLNKYEKLWLDTALREDSNSSDWTDNISDRFAHWVITWLKRETKNLKDELAANEFLYLKKEMQEVLRLNTKEL